MQAVNLINETDLTSLVKELTWDKKYIQTILTPSLKDRQFVMNNKEALAAMITNGYVRSKIHYFINNFKDTEFISPVTDTSKIPENTSLGSAPYRVNLNKVPAKFKEDILTVKNALHDQIIAQIDLGIENTPEGAFIIDLKKIRSSFPDIDVILQRATYEKAQDEVQKMIQEKESPQTLDFDKSRS